MPKLKNALRSHAGRRAMRALLIASSLLLLAGCAHHFNSEAYADPYGFFSGIWHGFVFPYALLTNLASWLLSLLDIQVLSSIEIIGRPNTGVFFYYIGFFLGLSAYGGGAVR